MSPIMEPTLHEPVLIREVVDFLVTKTSGTYVDATMGLAGHATAVLEKLGPEGRLLGLDWDPELLAMAEARLGAFKGRFTLVVANFKELDQVLEKEGIREIQGALFDLGISSYHYDRVARGFSFQRDEKLDMRLNPGNTLTAAAICNEWPVEQITHLLREYGEERQAYKIAKAIVARREKGPITTTLELRELIEAVLPRAGKIHPATQTFMALRIAVNRELENLTRGIESAAARLAKGGRLAVISFHSLEDRIVKSLFTSFVQAGGWTWAAKSPVTPGLEEVRRNPRARSAKMRVVERA
jgi:16S rRNA (cytosine1402-N4)-methyltransferase